MAILKDNPLADLSRYDLSHFIRHLERARRTDDLHDLLALETDDHRNAWYEAKNFIGDTAGFLTDISRAWKVSESDYPDSEPEGKAASVALQIRYALITSSVRSMLSVYNRIGVAGSIPGQLLKALVKADLWTPERTYGLVQAIDDQAQRLKATANLLECLPGDLREEALKDASASLRGLEDDSARAAALEAAGPLLTLLSSDEIADAFGSISNPRTAAELLRKVKDYLPEGLIQRIADRLLANTSSILESFYAKWAALVILPRFLPGHLVSSALDLAERSVKEMRSTPPFGWMGDLGVSDLVRELMVSYAALGMEHKVFEHAKMFDSEQMIPHKAQALARAAISAPPPLRRRLIHAALPEIEGVTDQLRQWAGAAEMLAPFLEQTEREILFARAESIENSNVRGLAVSCLMEYWSHPPDRGITSLARAYLNEIRVGYDRALAFARASRQLGQPEKNEFLYAALKASQAASSGLVRQAMENLKKKEEMTYAGMRKKASGDEEATKRVEGMIDDLEEFRRRRGFGTLPAAESTFISYAHADALAVIAPYLDRYIDKAFEEVERLPSRNARLRAIEGLAPYLERSSLQQALTLVEEIHDVDEMNQTLAALTISNGEYEKAIHRAHQINNEYGRAQALIALMPHLDATKRQKILEEIYDCIVTVNRMLARASGLFAAGHLITPALKRLAHMETEDIRAAFPGEDLVPDLLPKLSANELKAFVLLQRDEKFGERERAEVLALAAPHLDLKIIKKADEVLRSINALNRGAAIERIAMRLAELGLTEEAVTLILDSKVAGDDAARALTSILPHLSMAQVVSVTGEFGDSLNSLTLDETRAIIIAASSVPVFAESGLMAPLIIGRIEFATVNGSPIGELIEALQYTLALPFIEPDMRAVFADNALGAIERIDDSAQRATAIKMYAPHIREGEFDRLMTIALAISDEDDRSRALGSLLGHAPAHRLREFEDAVTTDAEAQTELITSLAKRWTEENDPKHALELAMRVPDVATRVRLLNEVAPSLCDLAPGEIYELWHNTLKGSANLPRPGLLGVLRSLVLVVNSLGGSDSIMAATRAVEDVTSWWP